MKRIMKKALTGLMLASIMIAASAQDAMPGQASAAFNQKISAELMAELPQDKISDIRFVTEKTIEKMRANIAGLKEAAVKDCIAINGEAKVQACQCAAEKTNYEEVFAIIRKQVENPAADFAEDARILAEKGQQLSLACGFTQAEIDAANAKVMKMMQGSAPKS